VNVWFVIDKSVMLFQTATYFELLANSLKDGVERIISFWHFEINYKTATNA